MIKSTKIFIILFFLLSCKTQTNKEEISSTCNRAISAIKNHNIKAFLQLLPNDLEILYKDQETIEYDLEKFNNLFNTYLVDKNPKVVITDLYNHLGQRLIKIPIYDNVKDSFPNNKLYLRHVNRLSIDLYFGPPSMMPLNKISGYMLVMDEDENYSNQFKPLSYWKNKN